MTFDPDKSYNDSMKRNKIIGHLESVGGIALAIILTTLFIGYVVIAPFFPESVIVKRLQTYGSTGQVFAVMGVIAIALIQIGVKTMIFKFKEFKESGRVKELEQENAVLRAENERLRNANAGAQDKPRGTETKPQDTKRT